MVRLDASQSRMSRLTKAFREAGLVLDRRDPQWVRYRRRLDLAHEIIAVIDAVLTAEIHLEKETA